MRQSVDMLHLVEPVLEVAHLRGETAIGDALLDVLRRHSADDLAALDGDVDIAQHRDGGRAARR